MTKAQKIFIIASVVISLLIVGGALLVAARKQPAPAYGPPAQRTVSKAELARADGKDGHDCLVAVSGTVYQIKDFPQWKDGKHTPSKGMAYCGADMTKQIDASPHGRSKLDVLIKVGPLEK